MRNRILTLAATVAIAVAAACGDANGPGGPGQVALLMDTLLFDYDSTDNGAEASEMEHTIKSFGIGVTRVNAVDSATLAGVLATHTVLVIPEALGGFDDSLKTGAQAVIRNWVDSTGGLLIINHNATNRQVLDSLFGYALATGTSTDRGLLNAADAAGTPFEGGPAVIWDNSAVTELTSASLPAGTLEIYTTVGGDVSVGVVAQGNGAVVLLGWDWLDAAPFGAQDGGWLEVLRRAIRM